MKKLELKSAVINHIINASLSETSYIDDVIAGIGIDAVPDYLHHSLAIAAAGHILKASGQVLVEIANETSGVDIYKSDVDTIGFEQAVFVYRKK
jgi:hypothetical protein